MRSGMARVRGITVLPATHTFIHKWNEPSRLYSVSIHQLAPHERGSAHPITAHHSFIDLERMKGWVGLVGRPCSGCITHISGHHQLQVERGTGKFAGYRPTFNHWTTQPTSINGVISNNVIISWHIGSDELKVAHYIVSLLNVTFRTAVQQLTWSQLIQRVARSLWDSWEGNRRPGGK